jgi:iron complex outermembrane receptor protein
MNNETKRSRAILLIGSSIAGLSAPATAQAVQARADTAASTVSPSPALSADAGTASVDNGSIQEIIVTAQKRSQAVNSVGMSIAAVTGDTLAQRGIQNVADLAKIVPGFVYTPSTTLSPVYTIRGIGFYDASIASAPAVSIYLDEVPIPFPIMSQGVSLDLQRVEVLKGPQGTLFGSNSTGGAVNYIAAKPTNSFETGGSVTYERFGHLNVDGFVSGPLSSTLSARLAVGSSQGGAWQRSITRNDKLGDRNFVKGRFLLDWTPSDRFKMELNLNGFIDKSETLAGQLIAIQPGNPVAVKPIVLAQPLAPRKNRAADWSPDWPHRNDNRMGQASLRADYEVTDTLTLTSLSSYAAMKVNSFYDSDATPTNNKNDNNTGSIRAFNQELRVAQDKDEFNWVVGANYEHARTTDVQHYDLTDASINRPFPDLPPFTRSAGVSEQKIDNYAFFANGQYNITDQLSLQAGARYSNSLRRAQQCGRSEEPNNAVGVIFERLQQLIGKADPILAPLGTCVQFDSTLTPSITPTAVRLHEDNISWRVGLNYKFDAGLLLYANASRGYKAGTSPTILGTSASQYIPAKQESVLAYEAGFKAPLFERRLQVNAAGFYYDYSDKQIRANIVDPLFGLEETISNVPKVRVWGLEANIQAQPVRGLSINGGITYLNSKITKSYVTFNAELQQADFKGSETPFTPRLQGNVDIQYEWALGSGLKPFVGAGMTYQGHTFGTFSVPFAPAPNFNIKEYALLDLRAGIASADDSWRLSVFGHNVTNTFYWTGLNYTSDYIVRYAGRPATYGVTLSVRLH